MFRLLVLAQSLVGPGDASPLPSSDLPSYGGLLLKTIVALGIVIALAWVLLRWGLRRLMPGPTRGSGGLRVLERQPLDARRSVVLVEAHGRYLLLGVSEGGVTLLCELDAAVVTEAERRAAARPKGRFAEVLRQALSPQAPAPEPMTRADDDTAHGREAPAEEAPDKERSDA